MLTENILRICRERGISVYKLEKDAGLKNGMIGKWKHSSPRIENVQKVASYLGCTIDDLLKET